MRDSNGELKDGYTILKELSVAYKGLGESYNEEVGGMVSLNDEMNKLLEDIGGKYNINTLTAGLANFDIAMAATESSMNSAGSASNEYATALDSIEKKAEGLAGQFHELVTSGGIGELIKMILDLGTMLLKLANNDFVQVIAGVGLLYIALTKLKSGFDLMMSSQIISYIKSFTSVIYMAIAGSEGLSVALTTIGFNPVVLAISAVVVALGVFTTAMTKSYKNSVEKVEQINKSFGELEESSNQIKEYTAQIKELDNQIANLGTENVSKLTLEKSELEALLILEEERNKKLRERANIQFSDFTKEQVIDSNLNNNSQEGTMSGQTPVSQTRAEAVSALSEKMREQAEVVRELNELEEKNGSLSEEQVEQKEAATEEYYKLKDAASSYVGELSKATNGADKSSDAYKDTSKAIDSFTNAVKDSEGAVEDASNATGDGVESNINYAQALEESNDAYANARDNVSSYADSMSALGDIVSDYNSNNGWTLDNLQSLLDMDAEYLAMLDMKEGKLSINSEKAKEYADSLITQAQMQAIETAQTKLAAIANGEYVGTLSQTTQASAFAQNAAINAGNSMIQSGNMAIQAAQNWAVAWATISNGYDISSSKQKAQAAEVESSLKIQLSSYESLRGNIGSYVSNVNKSTGAVNSNTGAVKANTSALEAQKKALEGVKESLEDEIDNYEIVIDYVKDMLDEEIEAIEDERDAILDATQDKIDALEDEMDAYEEKVDSVIDALKEEMDAYEENAKLEEEILKDKIDAEEEYWDAKIDALNKENELIEDNIELQRLQQNLALAQAKKVMVLEGGKFVYKADESAVSEAEDALSNYEREKAIEEQLARLEKLKEDALASLQEQLEKLQEYTDGTLDSYNQQIENLETSKNDKLSIYQQEIDNLENYLSFIKDSYDVRLSEYESYAKQFEDMLGATAKAQAKILYDELVGETKNWNDRIKALGTFVSNYEKKKSELSGIQSQIDNISSKISSATSSAQSQLNNLNSLNSQIASASKAESSKYAYIIKEKDGSEWYSSSAKYGSPSDALNAATGTIKKAQLDRVSGAMSFTATYKKYAKGTAAVGQNEIALVGDDPRFQELAIGANYNKGMGVPMSLPKGTGIVPAKETSTLTSMLTNLARGGINASAIDSGMIQNINIDTLALEGVNTPDAFAEAMASKFKNYMTQKSYKK